MDIQNCHTLEPKPEMRISICCSRDWAVRFRSQHVRPTQPANAMHFANKANVFTLDDSVKQICAKSTASGFHLALSLHWLDHPDFHLPAPLRTAKA